MSFSRPKIIFSRLLKFINRKRVKCHKNIEEDGACVNIFTETLDAGLRISESQTVATEKSNKDVQCDLLISLFKI